MEIRFQLEDALADKLRIALQLTGDDPDAVASRYVKQYLEQAFGSAAKEFRGATTPPPVSSEQNAQQDTRQRTSPPPFSSDCNPFAEWGKAIGRIPRWAKNPQQCNHRILRAFFELQQELGRVTLDALRSRCSDPNGHPETFVPHFDSNYTQMKFDNGNSHGKVFEEDGSFVHLWDRINDVVMRYRDFFL